MTRLSASFAVFSIVLILLMGCGSGDSGVVLGRGKTLVVHTSSDINGMNPPTTYGAVTDYIHQLVFDKVIGLDSKTLALKPTVSETMPEISPDGLRYTFQLKKNIYFSDGNPMRANDIVFSFKVIMNPFVKSAPVRAELHNFSDCLALDDFTVEFKLKAPGPKILDKLAINFFIQPKHIYDPSNISDGYSAAEGATACEDESKVSQDALDKMKLFSVQFENEKFQRAKGSVIGSGRYIFDDWVTGQTLRLVKNPNYWNAASGDPFAMQGMDTIIYKVIPDLETAFIALKNGDIDFSDEFKPAQISEKMKGPDFEKKFEVKTIPYPNYEYIGWNTAIRDHPERSFFADKRVRWAMSYLVDVPELVQTVLYGQGKPLTSLVFHERPEFNATLQPVSYNFEKAKALLYEAGWEDLDGNGTLEKEMFGRIIPFSFKMYFRQGNDTRRNIAILLQEKFKKAGIQMEPVPLDWSVMQERLKRHELDAWILAWVFDSNEQDYYQIYHSSQSNNEGFNWTQYQNAESDALIEQIQLEFDQEKRFELHKKVQQIVYDDQPYTLLFGNMARIVYNKRLKTANWYGQRPCYDLPQFTVAPAHKP